MSARENAFVPALIGLIFSVLAAIFSVLAALEGIHLFTSSDLCGGGFGHGADYLILYAALSVALGVTLVALGFALPLAIAGHRWVWVVGLLIVTAASVLITVGSNSQVARKLVGSVLGFGCSIISYPQVVQSFVPLLVAAPTLACLITGLRHNVLTIGESTRE